MSRVNPDELPGSMVTLGLVIEQPDQTARHISRLLDRRFRRSRLSRSTAHNALPRLAARGWVRRTHQNLGPERALDCYVATSTGIKAFRDWMYDLPGSGPAPTLREAMYGRIELCQLEDIPRLLQLARAEQEVSNDLYEDASRRVRALGLRRTDKLDFRQRARDVLLYVDPLHWSGRSERYRIIAEALEEIIADMRDTGLGVGDG